MQCLLIVTVEDCNMQMDIIIKSSPFIYILFLVSILELVYLLKKKKDLFWSNEFGLSLTMTHHVFISLL